MIGELIGARYKVIEVLGSGGFGHTYIAEDIQRPGNPRCVLKHLTFSSNDTAVFQQVRRLFQAEAETLERLGQHDQIPRLLAYFEENHQFYLVQEFIEGHPLSTELAKGIQLSEVEVVPLLEDVLNILEYVHAQGVIHRDIKPANLIRRRQDSKLVLIDFGAVKTIGNTVAETMGETSLSMPIYTTGYAASEQCLGRPRFSSDLYSLGMVGIQALTGSHPAQLPHDYGTSELIWRDQAISSDELAAVLHKMTRFHFMERFHSASEALQALRKVISTAPTLLTTSPEATATTTLISEPTRDSENSSQITRMFTASNKPSFARVGLAILGTLAIAVLGRSLSDAPNTLPWQVSRTLTPPGISLESDRISTGSKQLNRWSSNPPKQQGIDHIAAGNYDKAVTALEAARAENPSDPETLIYLNNARIGTSKAHLIAVAVPLSSTLDSAQEILRGVAAAQNEINQAGGIQGVSLKVAIADDSNQREVSQQVAESLTKNPNLLGIIGHGTSDTSLAAAQVYQDQRLVMIAPVSSAMKLGEIGDHIFQTMPTDQQTAKALKDYMVRVLQKRRVVVFYNSNSQYSQSLTKEFKAALDYSGVANLNVIEEVDLSRPDFDAEDSVNRAIASKTEVLMLAPDNEVMDKAIRVIESANRRIPILGGDSMFTARVPKIAKDKAMGIVLAVPVDVTDTPFLQRGTKLWGQRDLISWRTALAYDAAQALIKGLSQDPTRDGVYRALSEPNFSVPGAKGMVSFQAKRNQLPSYITVAPITTGSNKRYLFTPLNPRFSNSTLLNKK
ncbi:bifunctional serine/threonine-protein kinase/ABC transporter substrate-binding protein [Leptolyngbya sp. Cla-17]|uniref:bifunctional serine/threonine-protein kinase/ABC transporter substrate-binding protein n=1 Tax=Leptolyngbya sp. Cla-17 TaxID=2803751 RepID=UPI001F5E012B|nr:bifunctional serine/threonine-protein kinase/ABC transporter substrate-binding protein [Leptolyngbya sp. Cla-17]